MHIYYRSKLDAIEQFASNVKKTFQNISAVFFVDRIMQLLEKYFFATLLDPESISLTLV